jgi:hypothetical protein
MSNVSADTLVNGWRHDCVYRGSNRIHGQLAADSGYVVHRGVINGGSNCGTDVTILP